MVQPISLLMSQFNVENSAQLTRNALAAAQDTGQGQEVVRDSLRRTQMVQANEAAAGVRKSARAAGATPGTPSGDPSRQGKRRPRRPMRRLPRRPRTRALNSMPEAALRGTGAKELEVRFA